MKPQLSPIEDKLKQKFYKKLQLFFLLEIWNVSMNKLNGIMNSGELVGLIYGHIVILMMNDLP